MCGICGVVGTVHRDALDSMTRVLAHRGPDAEGIVAPVGEPFAFGHRRLSIIDLSSAGAQPMSDPSGRFWITYNGEVYNFRELRRELEGRGRAFRSATDTEVVLAAYEAWGPRCLERLNGMFAFAIWDRAERTLFAARDRLGIKPFYWAETKSGLLFASEVKAILRSGLVGAEPDPQVMHNPWHYPSSPRSGFRGIQKLPAGHSLTWRDGRTTVRRWWSIEPKDEPIEGERAEEELAALVEEAVRMQMVSDVPIGALLSGGLDSSMIVSLMQKHTRGSVHTFTIVFRPSDRRLEVTDEDGRHARRIAERIGCDHRELEVSPDVVTLLPRMVWHLDEPLADPAALNTYLIAEAARANGVTVLLNGMGADEVFGGYRKHLACLLASRYQSLLPGPVRSIVEKVAGSLPVAGRRSGFRMARWTKRFLGFASRPPLERFLLSDLSLSPEEYRNLYVNSDRYAYERLSEVKARKGVASRPGVSYLTRMCLADTTIFLPDHNLTYADKATMAAGVESRPPLIDHRIVEFAFCLNDRFRIRGLTQKALLRRVASRWLPRSIVNRPKSPFGVPLRAWVRTDLREMIDDLLSEKALRSRALYKPAAVRALIEQDRKGQEDHSHLIWSLLSREVWYRTFIDGSGAEKRRETPYHLAGIPGATGAVPLERSAVLTRHRAFGAGDDARRSLLFIVQLPPPVHGVTLMNEAVIRSAGVHAGFDIDVVALRFATSPADVGRFNVRKLFLAATVALRLLAKCSRRRPDAAYFTLVPSGIAYYRDILFVAVLKLLGIPIIFHLHGRGVREAARSWWRRRLYSWTFSGATVIHLSDRLYEDIEAFVPRDRCHILPNGILDWGGSAPPAEPRGEGAAPRVLYLSNMRESKGALVALEALGRLRDRGVPFEALFVGAASESDCLARFDSIVAERGLGEAVRYVGPRYGEDKMRAMAEADLFMFPSLQECLPLVILEAMSAGLPVVATDQGGVADLVEDGKTGFLVPVGDADAIADRMEELIRRPDLRRQMGDEGRRRFVERYTLDRFNEGIWSIFEKVVRNEPLAARAAARAESPRS
jgi:asparagine synthase (glutamine-hydrolysing)